MRTRSLVLILIAVVAIVAAAVVLRGQGGEVLGRWLSTVHGH